MRRVWPEPGDELDDAALFALYDPPRRDLPCVRMNFVTSLDGAVTVDGVSEPLSGTADKRVFALLRDVCDALLVGAGTVRHERYRAVKLDSDRRARRMERGLPAVPTLVVVSGALDLDPGAALFTEAPVRPIVVTHAASPASRRAALGAVADVEVCGDTVVDLGVALDRLAGRGLRQVLCEGGPHLFGALTAASRVDELCLTLSPLLAGPGAGRITDGPTTRPAALRLAHVLEADGTLLLRYVRG